MTGFTDIPLRKQAASSDIQQVIDALTGRRNTPLTITVNDPIAYALTIKNTDPSGRGLILFGPDGSTVWMSIDATGVKVSPDGTTAVTPVTAIGPQAGAAAEGNHVHGADGYAGTGTVTLEALYAAATATVSADYTVPTAIMFVECTTGVTVTLPDATTTNRPITIISVAGTQTVHAAGGSVFGGSVNLTTGAVLDGVVNAGNAITYKSDGTNWRAV